MRKHIMHGRYLLSTLTQEEQIEYLLYEQSVMESIATVIRNEGKAENVEVRTGEIPGGGRRYTYVYLEFENSALPEMLRYNDVEQTGRGLSSLFSEILVMYMKKHMAQTIDIGLKPWVFFSLIPSSRTRHAFEIDLIDDENVEKIVDYIQDGGKAPSIMVISNLVTKHRQTK